jgi:microfibrillar-associated protein 1
MVINHTDDSGLLLPEDPRDRRDLNLVCFNGATPADDKSTWSPRRMPTSYTMATHMISPPPNLKLGPPVPVFQTTNPFVDIRAERILSVATLERALLTVDAKNALRGLYKEEGRRWWQCAAEAESSLGHLQGAGRLESDATPGIWMCGSYASAGIPLLEGCVVSARNVYRGICKSEKIIPGKVARF